MKIKHYKSIEDCPIWNLNKVNETGDVRYLLKLDDYYDDLPLNGFSLSDTLTAYKNITAEITKHFGLDESFISKMREEKEMIIITLKILSGEKHLKAIREVKKKEKQERNSTIKIKEQSFDEKIIVLESHFNRDFDVQRMSVKKFYTYLNLFKRSQSK